MQSESMKVYISLLRGINVSGQKIIKMEDLRILYEKLGFKNVTTYLQSGNVVFKAADDSAFEYEKLISQQVEKEYGYKVPVIVLTLEQLEQVVKNNPFLQHPEKDAAACYVTLLSAQPQNFNKKEIEDKRAEKEEIVFTDNALYLYCPSGYGRTKLNNNFLEGKLKVSATTRNWKTTVQLYDIAVHKL